jgi:hypothetical protein
LENDSVFNQVFRGVPKCGHYSLLIIDRTVDKLGRLVFLDSLPDMFHDTMDILQAEYSIWNSSSSRGVQVDLCKHAKARHTNDGLWNFHGMCMASLYTKSLLAQCCLSVNGNASDFTDIVITFNCYAITVGGAGHDHMLTSIHLG